MTDEQFKTLFKRIEAAFNQEYTALQFEEWLDSFGGEDLGVAERAFRLMKEDFAYPPVVATFRSYIQRIKQEDEAKANRTLSEKKEIEDAKRKPKSFDPHGWVRFTRYMLQEKKKWPKHPDGSIDRDETEKLKAKFEKEHLNWQAKKRREVKRGGMTRLGASLGDAMGNLE